MPRGVAPPKVGRGGLRAGPVRAGKRMLSWPGLAMGFGPGQLAASWLTRSPAESRPVAGNYDSTPQWVAYGAKNSKTPPGREVVTCCKRGTCEELTHNVSCV